MHETILDSTEDKWSPILKFIFPKDERILYMEQKSGLFIKIGTAFVLFLAIGFIAVVVAVFFRPNQNVQEQPVLSSSNLEEDIPDETGSPEPDSVSEDYVTYVVQRGATLSVIAKAYSEALGKEITVQDIMDANNMAGHALTPGQELKIPKR